MTGRPLHRGFTLIELLVATGIFIVGFAAVFTLFLSGMRFRKLADDTTLTATLASSLTTEVYLDSGAVGAAGTAAPEEYDGDGFGTPPAVAITPTTPFTDYELHAYAGVPGALYRLENTSDLTGTRSAGAPDNAEMTTAIVTDIIALCPGSLIPAGTVPTFGDLERRLHLITSKTQPTGWATMTEPEKAVAYEDELVKRGIALRYRAVIVRQPHWMR
jgi:prepilin-type N-terminal cleavage/methylation domain-containing protein